MQISTEPEKSVVPYTIGTQRKPSDEVGRVTLNVEKVVLSLILSSVYIAKL